MNIEEIGKPTAFDIEQYIEVIKQMALADEIRFALQMIENVPAYYRDFPDKRLEELKRQIYLRTFSTRDYVNDSDEIKEIPIELRQKIDTDFCYPRGPMIQRLVEKYNIEGTTPHIVELGPFDYWLPYGLEDKGCKFTYEAINISKFESQIKYANKEEIYRNQPIIFVACEVIEHFWRPEDITHYFHQAILDVNLVEAVVLSTPKYTMGGGLTEWTLDDKFGHLRTWTPNELMKFGSTNFPFINQWVQANTPLMVLLGSNRHIVDNI